MNHTQMNEAAIEFFKTQMTTWDPVAILSTNYGNGEYHERLTKMLQSDVNQAERSASGKNAPLYRRTALKAAEQKLARWTRIRDQVTTPV